MPYARKDKIRPDCQLFLYRQGDIKRGLQEFAGKVAQTVTPRVCIAN